MQCNNIMKENRDTVFVCFMLNCMASQTDGYECPKGTYSCRASTICVTSDEVCDGVKHCPGADDELFCGNAFNVIQLQLRSIQDNNDDINTQIKLIKQRKIICVCYFLPLPK